MRGLKQKRCATSTRAQKVASFTDAWIETWSCKCYLSIIESHLLQMRGLKLVTMYAKVNNIGRIFYRCVDWNVISDKTIISLFSRIFYRCVDWNLKSKNNRSFRTRRIFYRCVDWNVNLKVRPCFLYKSHLLQMRGLKQAHEVGKDLNTGRIFYRCVDWNRNMFYNI